MTSVELLKKLISFPSVTPDDGGSIDFIATILELNGFKVHIQEFGLDKVKNLYAVYFFLKPGKNICFAGHVDVVPPGPGWSSDPFAALEKEGVIYGRGAVDMKGAIACMLSAAIELIKQDALSGAISFLITADEEGDAKYGTKAMLEWMSANNHKIDFAIVGEPTCEKLIGDVVKIGRRGSINFILKVIGKQGHVAYPHLAENPCSVMIKILQELEELNFGDESNLEVTSIDTDNVTSNVIPGESCARFNVRFTNRYTPEDLSKKVGDIVEKYTHNYILELKCGALPFVSKSSNCVDIFTKAIYKQTLITPSFSMSGGTSDARFIQNYCPVIEFGLKSELAHKINESVEIDDLQRLYNVYYDALYGLLSFDI